MPLSLRPWTSSKATCVDPLCEGIAQPWSKILSRTKFPACPAYPDPQLHFKACIGGAGETKRSPILDGRAPERRSTFRQSPVARFVDLLSMALQE
jgi:hypothetical protein